jgi:hypothetical protein
MCTVVQPVKLFLGLSVVNFFRPESGQIFRDSVSFV